MIDIAKGKAASENIENIQFRCETPEECTEADSSLNVVMAHNIFHLCEGPAAAINVAYRFLKPGGAFVTSTVCLADSFSPWRILLVVAKLFGKVPHVNVLKRETLDTYLSDAGFEVDFQWRQQKMAALIILKKLLA